MNYENFEKWMRDLETTADPQTTGALTDSEGDCCIGRLCKVAIAEGEPIEVQRNADYVFYDGHSCTAPLAVERFLGGGRAARDVIGRGIDLNDSEGATFEEIAADLRRLADEYR